jgi:hypothetical protein
MFLQCYTLVNTKKLVVDYYLFVCMYVRMWPLLVPEGLDVLFSYSVFNSLSVIWGCPVNINIPGQKVGAPPQEAPRNKVTMIFRKRLQ